MLKNIPLFSELSDSELEIISRLAVPRNYAKKSLIFSEGDLSNSMYVIVYGKVKVFLADEEGKEITLNTHSAGEYFGELALLDNDPRSASVVAVEDTKLLVITRNAFHECLERNPEISFKVMCVLVQRLRDLTDNVKSLALMDVYGRVARVLLDLAIEKEGKKVITQRLTQRDIASLVGASREMVSRILRDLTTGGYITIQNKIITINNRLPAAW